MGSETAGEAVEKPRKPTISEACDIADERERKALIAAFVEALREVVGGSV